MGRPFRCPKCSQSDRWRMEYYESAYQDVEVELGDDGKPVVVDYPGRDYGNYDCSGLDESLRCLNCDSVVDLADVRELPLGRYDALVAALRRLCRAVDMSDPGHPDFRDSGADVVEALWVGDDPRRLLKEVDKETSCRTTG